MNDELIKALRCEQYGDDECENAECPFWSELGCRNGVANRDAADALERLMAQVAELEEDKEFLQFLAKLYHDELDEETKKNIDGHLHYDCRKGEKSDV